jgi:magnesium chelatase family protein
MSLALVRTRAQLGVDAPEVAVEVYLSRGLPRFSIVGLPEAAVRESRDRVRAAIEHSELAFPRQVITVNLAPADLPKEGGRFDLAIAVGVLAASRQLRAASLSGVECYGELSLGGELRPFRGALSVAVHATRAGRALLVPAGNADEAALAERAEVLAAPSLRAVYEHLSGRRPLSPHPAPRLSASGEAEAGGGSASGSAPAGPDLADVRGQAHARRVLELAAAGGHSLLMMGPPGSGKSMLASRLPGLLPSLSAEQMLETAAIHSLAGRPPSAATLMRRPFRAPHHSASVAALVGGGASPRPGEISLAHHGVLFLDELPEFRRDVLEALREPLESHRVVIARAARSVTYPARLQLVAAMNPCPCGYLGEPRCHCAPPAVERYRQRISGPLLDRIDLQINVPRPTLRALESPVPDGESSAVVAARVADARARQLERSGVLNAALSAAELAGTVRPDGATTALLRRAGERLQLSARGYHRVLRVARTIADLQSAEEVQERHVAEALACRVLAAARAG